MQLTDLDYVQEKLIEVGYLEKEDTTKNICRSENGGWIGKADEEIYGLYNEGKIGTPGKDRQEQNRIKVTRREKRQTKKKIGESSIEELEG